MDIVVGAVLQVLFERLASRQFLDLFKRWKFDETIHERLKITLLTVNAVLADAEEKQITNPSVKDWINELKDAVLQAEDILDEVATEAESVAKKNQLLPRNYISALDMFTEDPQAKLEKITSKLEQIATGRDLLGLKGGRDGKPSPRFPTTSLVNQSKIYGRDDDKEEIMKFLLPCNANIKEEMAVIAILGFGGIGKTTLAQLLYNDSDVQKHFHIRAWAYVSVEFDVFKITKTIFESITSQPCYTTNLNSLQVRLKEELNGKRFLLVLDDLWNENYALWNLLRSPFEDADSGSRIIVTTRNQPVASTMRAVVTRPLRHISDEDCWSVFVKHAFEDHDEETDRHPRRKEIVGKCKGLPLAAKTLGGLLHSKVEARERDRILNSKIWDLPADKSSILPSLMVSYYYLPEHLQQCFAYCSIFPKGYAFEKEKLIFLWMAEGFLQQKEGREMEDIGDEYFFELISRSFFQQKSPTKFIMHDLIADLAQFAAGVFFFRYESDELQGISEKARHFSYLRKRHCKPMEFEALREVRSLRTFLPLSFSNSTRFCFLDNMFTEKILPSLSRLRVLSLSHYKIDSMKSDFFENLKHIRFLDLSYSAIKELPKSACCLYNLQTLILSYCPNLTELPADISNLSNLRYLDLTGTKLRKMPLGFDRLKSLQTLTTFIASLGSGGRISELGDLPHLHDKLSISELQNVVDAADAERAYLKNKVHLKEIDFKWNASAHDSQKETDVLAKLRPHENIEKLSIQNYGGTKFPDWLGNPSFSKMVFLRLSDCQNCTSLPSLGQLSGLEELHVSRIKGLKRIGPEFYFDGSPSIKPFKSLLILRLDDMPDLEEWSSVKVEGGEFPSLQNLHLWKCSKLDGNLPNRLPSLKSLHIHECRKLDFQPEDVEYKYEGLQQLSIGSSCDSLIFFPLGFFSNLEDLQIADCRNLKSVRISDELQENLISLQKLEISDCHNLESFSGIFKAPNLKELSITNCKNLTSMPEQMHSLLPSHPEWKITNCPKP